MADNHLLVKHREAAAKSQIKGHSTRWQTPGCPVIAETRGAPHMMSTHYVYGPAKHQGRGTTKPDAKVKPQK